MSERVWRGPEELLESEKKVANYAKDIIIRDCTLREGEQAADITFSVDDKLQIAHKLEEIGIKHIQVGMPGRSEIDRAVFEKLRSSQTLIEALIIAYAPNWKEEIDAAVAAGAQLVDIVFPSSEYRLTGVMNLSQDEMLVICRRIVAYAKQKGLDVSFGPTDGTRTSIQFLRRIGKMVVEEGADCLNISDTVGIATPEVIKNIVRNLRDLDIKLAIHAHNDIGLALANSLAAVQEGVNVVDVCVNGLGDRSGNLALDEFVVVQQEVLGYPLGIKTEGLYELSQLVGKRTRFPVAPTKPLMGRQAFSYKFDTHVEAVTKSMPSFQGINPQLVGRNIEVVLGTTSGPSAIRVKSKELGIVLDERRMKEIVALVKQKALELRRALNDQEFREIVAQFLK